jgi:hypothetical protein
MNRILQITLGLIIFNHFTQTVILFSSIPDMFNSLTARQDTAHALKWESSAQLGGLKLSNAYYFDSLSGKSVFAKYAGMQNMKPEIFLNNEPYVMSKSGDLVRASYVKDAGGLQIPVDDRTFYSLLVTSLIILVGYMALLIYVAVQLFRFVTQTSRQNFFSTENRTRLRLFGGFMLFTAIGSYLITNGTPWLLQTITGTSGYRLDLQANTSMVISFPSSLIAGLLMFIIAEAFGKGQTLQTEQDLTI